MKQKVDTSSLVRPASSRKEPNAQVMQKMNVYQKRVTFSYVEISNLLVVVLVGILDLQRR